MAKTKKIICEYCAGEIKNGGELVVTTNFLSVVPYHDRCFTYQIKGLSTFFVSNVPLNGQASNVGTVFAVVLGVLVLFMPELRYLAIIALISVLYRLYSWFKFERYL